MGSEGRGFCTRERAGYRSVLIDSGCKKGLTRGRSQRPKGRPACISAQLTQSALLHEGLNTLVVEGNKQAIRGIKLMAKWWRKKSNLVHQPCCLASASVTGCQALGPGLANLCACAGLP